MWEVDQARARIADGESNLVGAQRAMMPFQPAIDQARQGVNRAQKEMWSAHRRLELWWLGSVGGLPTVGWIASSFTT